MERRDALKALAFVPFMIGKRQVDAAEVKPGSYVVFADPAAFDFESVESMREEDVPVELRNAVFIPVRRRLGESVQDVVGIYKLDAD